jgi:hypothetical protein
MSAPETLGGHDSKAVKGNQDIEDKTSVASDGKGNETRLEEVE